MTDIVRTLLVIGVASLCTAAVRFAPFIIFRGSRGIPKKIQYLGDILPPAIIATLVVYCLKDVSFVKYPYGVAELISVALVAVLHLKKGNVLISIGGGTLVYMLLVSLVFV